MYSSPLLEIFLHRVDNLNGDFHLKPSNATKIKVNMFKVKVSLESKYEIIILKAIRTGFANVQHIEDVV